MEGIEEAGYLANVHALDEEGDAELEDPEIKAAKVYFLISLFVFLVLCTLFFQACSFFLVLSRFQSSFDFCRLGSFGSPDLRLSL